VQVLKEPDKPATSESRMWVYASGKRNPKPIRYFEYQPDRSGENARRFLKDFHGCLVTDGYSGYNKVDGVTRFGCWTHTQRKWREAMPKGATTATSKAAVGYDFCNKLFALERKLEKLDCSTRRIARQVEAAPLLEAYWLWIDTLNPAPGSKLEDAAHYSQNQKEYLSAFLEHGNVEISNNLAENAIRPFVLGRKNWLFCDSVKGADSSAIVYTLVETAKANDIEPYRYLLYVLSVLPYIGTNPSNAELDQFMPWSPELRDELERSRRRLAALAE
jgi:transposase